MSTLQCLLILMPSRPSDDCKMWLELTDILGSYLHCFHFVGRMMKELSNKFNHRDSELKGASVICMISHINDPHHLITFATTLPSSPPSSALITILPFMSPPLRPLCILSTFINTIIHLRPFFDRPPIIYVVSSFRA